ncbi:hypothetical protein SAMN04488490_0913 [Marinobacter sp. LV10R510-11A]|uniref:hypothetical protein n=1 Tax=Marinobacter sp. LV10R510-11A TaxID=1415568 RepID=UPI000BB735CA|nr:hypothetical protein [Marinobacter sp. LV10R510-11A]SOB75336.1 hypothetical protein SAMN04488490_0913 [Marinobacter sp. LV10R510-11A]
MKIPKKQVQSLDAYKRKRLLVAYANAWQEALPRPSLIYPNLIFVYPEDLATQDRELLFRKLDLAAAQNKQKLVISDCHYSRAGFYIVFDEIGGDENNPVDIDEIVEEWSERERR